MEYFKSEKTKIGFKTYLILIICLVVYFIAGGYGFMLFPFNTSFLVVGIGVVVCVPFLLYFLKIDNK
ncbi:hypothetical protein [Hwangdonia lutea]|uniref:Uncharacterized protein n=1 Tax=Hwangdonia lutea TaxID=3075823 RepID=A0AA97EL90_9FLAO|nr:hypothetical protein [Hwangdonia sp. SCSIO 19198]WOD42145.1 hypothetical protein RNZ46_09055 [Hwangdonia sp. SCSIO 19198]